MATGNNVISRQRVASDVSGLDSIIRNAVWGADNSVQNSEVETKKAEDEKKRQKLQQEYMLSDGSAARAEEDTLGLGPLTLNKLLDMYGLDKSMTANELEKFILMQKDMKDAGLLTEDEKRAQKLAGIMKGAKAGTDFGSKLAELLPESTETVAAPARGFGVVHRK